MITFYRRFSFLLITPVILHLFGCSGLDMTSPEPEKKPVSVLTGKQQGTPLDELLNKKGINYVI